MINVEVLVDSNNWKKIISNPKKLIIDRLIIILGTADLAMILPSLVNGGNLFGITKIT